MRRASWAGPSSASTSGRSEAAGAIVEGTARGFRTVAIMFVKTLSTIPAAAPPPAPAPARSCGTVALPHQRPVELLAPSQVAIVNRARSASRVGSMGRLRALLHAVRSAFENPDLGGCRSPGRDVVRDLGLCHRPRRLRLRSGRHRCGRGGRRLRLLPGVIATPFAGVSAIAVRGGWCCWAAPPRPPQSSASPARRPRSVPLRPWSTSSPASSPSSPAPTSRPRGRSSRSSPAPRRSFRRPTSPTVSPTTSASCSGRSPWGSCWGRAVRHWSSRSAGSRAAGGVARSPASPGPPPRLRRRRGGDGILAETAPAALDALRPGPAPGRRGGHPDLGLRGSDDVLGVTGVSRAPRPRPGQRRLPQRALGIGAVASSAALVALLDRGRLTVALGLAACLSACRPRLPASGRSPRPPTSPGSGSAPASTSPTSPPGRCCSGSGLTRSSVGCWGRWRRRGSRRRRSARSSSPCAVALSGFAAPSSPWRRCCRCRPPSLGRLRRFEVGAPVSGAAVRTSSPRSDLRAPSGGDPGAAHSRPDHAAGHPRRGGHHRGRSRRSLLPDRERRGRGQRGGKFRCLKAPGVVRRNRPAAGRPPHGDGAGPHRTVLLALDASTSSVRSPATTEATRLPTPTAEERQPRACRPLSGSGGSLQPSGQLADNQCHGVAIVALPDRA